MKNLTIKIGAVAFAIFGMAPAIMAASPAVIEGSIMPIPVGDNKDNIHLVYTYNRDIQNNDNTFEFSIFDSDFQEVKSFSVKSSQYTYTQYTQSRVYTFREVIPHPYEPGERIEIDGVSTGISDEQALEWVILNINKEAQFTTLPDGQKVISYEWWKDIGSDKYHNYPIRYFYKNEAGVWKMVICEWEGKDWGPYGDWGKVQENTEAYAIAELPLFNMMSFNGGYSGRTFLTQKIFNDDDNLCYAMPVVSLETYSYETESCKKWGKWPIFKSIKVMNDLGAEVLTFDLPTGYNFKNALYDCEDIGIINLEGKTYAIISAYKYTIDEQGGYDIDGKSYSVIYAIDSKRGSVSQVAIQPSSRISPRAPKRGEPVTVTLSEKASENGCYVRVIAANGQTVSYLQAPAGQNTIDIDTSRMQNGVYVVTVNAGNTTEEAAKIIVR